MELLLYLNIVFFLIYSKESILNLLHFSVKASFIVITHSLKIFANIIKNFDKPDHF